MIKTLPITQAREEFPTLVANAKKKLTEYIITVQGMPSAILMSVDEYESWQETNEILRNPQLLNAMKLGEKDIEKKDYISLEELKREL